MAYRQVGAERDEFRRYLDRCGVPEALTKVFTKLLRATERPENPIKFIRDNLVVPVDPDEESEDSVQNLKLQLEEAHKEIAELKKLTEKFKALNVDDTIKAHIKTEDADREEISVQSITATAEATTSTTPEDNKSEEPVENGTEAHQVTSKSPETEDTKETE